MNRSAPRAGFVLASVLGVLVLFAGLVGAITLLVRSGVDDARLAVDDLEADALLRAGLELAGYQLFVLKAPAAGLAGQQIRLDAGTVTLSVLAESARIDLNGSDPKLIAAAWRAAGLKTMRPEQFAARVADWRDGDGDVGEGGGAEAADYDAAGVGWRPRNDGFRSVDELRWVLGVGADDVRALRPYFTVANPAGTIDLYDAPEPVLRALPGLSSSAVGRLLKLRQKRSDETSEALKKLVGETAQALVTTDPPVAYRIGLKVASGRGVTRAVEAVITADSTGSAPYRVIEWRG